MKKTTTDSAKQLLVIKRKVSTQWIKAHQHQYAEQYVALESDTLIAHGKTRRELVEVLKKEGKESCFIAYVPNPEKVY
ncbi:MAG: hypothetical protein JNM06_09340 [Blastocatellia bacterium]|nr:hypothetical protein [Blastocatellia bacterium]